MEDEKALMFVFKCNFMYSVMSQNRFLFVSYISNVLSEKYLLFDVKCLLTIFLYICNEIFDISASINAFFMKQRQLTNNFNF